MVNKYLWHRAWLIILAGMTIGTTAQQPPVNPRPWIAVNIGGVSDLAISQEGTVWVVQNGQVLSSTATGATWTRATAPVISKDTRNVNRPFTRVSAQSDTQVFAVSSDGGIWKWNGRQWSKTVASGMGDVGVSQNGTVWAAGANGTVWFSHDEGVTWTQVHASDFRNIAAGSDQQVWGVGSNGKLWKYDGQNWTETTGLTQPGTRRLDDGTILNISVPAFFTDVSVAANGDVWATDQPGGAYGSRGQGQFQLHTTTNAGYALWVAATDGTLWAVKQDGTVWRR
jgi:hypothetical protein